ncbi:alpha-glucosidase [Pseudobutyrivibrio ruminis]|uniref:Oligo-1,6-glucosidase n=1 Tax=Pseudobutyrivibrio ruminis DSM 9787 TaxID=1123011 RepID=A0A285SRT2_9FIRM|nr:alpha-glucosidase [Pseudobutyrivibrio ruminis]SOC10647.1 oligo-1,6-glucosidase [Pseudobutyrivibrio ruminis DSM 9787]
MEKKWWHNKVAYQIYPKSFYDTNGDGIGDINGVIEKLDYLRNLGIDIIWLSPIYCSPLADQGYDISDYYDIDPRFGTIADLDRLIEEGKKRGIGIVMDLVVNHCSDEHEWFKKACEDPDGEYGKFFYIEDYKDGDPLPCNWRSYFGGSVWEKLPGHDDKIYLHVFHKKQPDLNWENPKLRKEVYQMINWWLDKGIAGFRIDAIINIKKKLPFSDYPVDGDDGLSSIDNMLKEATGVGEFLNELADETFRKHDAFTVGEVFNEKDEELPLFIGSHGYFSTMFDFSAESTKEDISPENYKNAIFNAHERVDGIGFLSNIIENHDEPRGVSRFIPKEDLDDTSKKMLAGIYFLLPGLPFIYQGQEIGMENLDKVNDVNDLDDCANANIYETALHEGKTHAEALAHLINVTRDNARTPFQWDDSENAGFTSGNPWLLINPKYKHINLAEQINNSDSVFNFYKELISLRKNPEYESTLVYGEFAPYKPEQKNLLAYSRVGEKSVMVIANYQKDAQTLSLPSKIKKVLLSNTSKTLDNSSFNGTEIVLSPYELLVVEMV